MPIPTFLARLSKINLSVLIFLSSIVVSAQLAPLSPKATVSVLTCATGNESYSLFGHTAVRIADPEQFLDVVYNYGAFDFSTPNFVAKFAKGDLQYFVVADSFSEFIGRYQYEGRSVYEQKLRLSLPLKQQLFDQLNKTLQSEERFYTYKFIDRNYLTKQLPQKQSKKKTLLKRPTERYYSPTSKIISTNNWVQVVFLEPK